MPWLDLPTTELAVPNAAVLPSSPVVYQCASCRFMAQASETSKQVFFIRTLMNYDLVEWWHLIMMAALCNRAGIYIFALWFLLSSSILCLPYFHTWCGLSANLGCRSETCCTRLAENTGRKKSPSGHHRTTLSGYIFATKACMDNRKKTC